MEFKLGTNNLTEPWNVRICPLCGKTRTLFLSSGGGSDGSHYERRVCYECGCDFEAFTREDIYKLHIYRAPVWTSHWYKSLLAIIFRDGGHRHMELGFDDEAAFLEASEQLYKEREVRHHAPKP